jgi:predicted transcriptional regulator
MKNEKKFIVTKRSNTKEDTSVIMSIRVNRDLQERLDKIAYKTNRSRNEIVNLALNYAVENAEIEPN